MRSWSPSFDMSTVPDRILMSELGRRNGKKRKSYSGGVVWAEHNPDTDRCRCADCIVKREERKAELAKLPKPKRGRPRKSPEVAA